MNEMPKFLDKRIFGRIFDIGEVAKLKQEDQMDYETSLKRKWDWESALSSAVRKGRAEGQQKGVEMGRAEGNYKTIKNLIAKFDMSDEDIASATEMSLDFVQQVRKKLKDKK